MTLIEFKTESGNIYLVDVIQKKIRFPKVKEGSWIPYEELLGKGEIGQPMTVVWNENNSVQTAPVVALRFVS